MRVERLPEYVTTVTVTALGIAFALYCGTLTGSGQTQVVMMMFGLIASTIVLLTLRGLIWVLIPITWSLTGIVPSLPIPLTLRDVIVLFTGLAFLLLISLKLVRLKPKYTLLDLFVAANLLYLATAYIRNPVGALFFESQKVGGRPYLNVAIGFVAYFVLSRAKLGPRLAGILPWGAVFGSMVEGILGVLAAKLPIAVPYVMRFYVSDAFTEWVNPNAATNAEVSGSGRKPMLMYFGGPLASALYARYRALTLINPLYFIRCIAFIGACVLVLLSGFRSAVLSIAAGFIIATYARDGFRAVARLAAIGAPILIIIIALQGVLFELPLPAQRALSFLPGRWDYVAVAEARGSTEWRVEMWRTVLSSNRYIENKILGDGFGFTQVEMQIRNIGNIATPEEMQERYMVTGGFHSGPVSSIRYVGVVGLVLFVTLLVLLAKRAWLLMTKTRGTPYEFLAFFIGIPIVYEPFNFIVVFGAFDSAFPQALLGAGMLKMLENSLPAEPLAIRETIQNRSPILNPI